MEGNNGILYSNRFIGIFPGLRFDCDVVDIPAQNPIISNLDIFFLAFSILVHIVDVGFDINIAIGYLLDKKMEYFLWTISVIFIPSIINVVISKRMQYQDYEAGRGRSAETEQSKLTRIITKGNICCFIALFQLAPVIHYCDALRYAWKSRRCKEAGDFNGQRHYYVKMLKEDQDVALLRVFECFLEAAPQVVLQLTILLKGYHDYVNLQFFHQLGSICSSSISMSWAMANYNRSIRLAQEDKNNIGIVGSILQFLWHFCITVSRIVSIAIIASIWPLYTVIGCIIHWIIMTSWIIGESHGILQFCRHKNRALHMPPTIGERTYSILFAFVIGIVHLFIYLNAIDGRTLKKYIFFYVLSLLENVIISILWMVTSSLVVKNTWYFHTAAVLCIIPFLLGIISMLVYYILFHPSMKSHHCQSISLNAI